jgi:hypothetical protein
MIFLQTLGICAGVFVISVLFAGQAFWLTNRVGDHGGWPWNWRLIWGPSYINWRYARKRSMDSLNTPLMWTTYGGMLSVNQMRGMLGYGTVGSKSPLPTRQQTDPFVGYKTLRVVASDGRLQFRGWTGTVYGLDATASCHAGGIVVFTPAMARQMMGLPPLSEEEENAESPSSPSHSSPSESCSCGFYALKDRPSDWEYGAFLASVELFGKVVVAKLGWRAERQRILKIEAKRTCVVDNHNVPAVGFSTSADGSIIAVCAEHGVLGYSTPAELTGKLGTEVRWADV